MPVPRIPVSTYRLQFNHAFRFSDARRIIPYLHDLGITDIYASPYFRAKKGSLHGYDVVDPNTLNPEVGTEEEYDLFVEELKKYGMGQILDIVPNHMCNGSDNLWWMDVLENGRSSQYAEFFDIDWTPAVKRLTDKILIPLLGDQYGKVLENQDLKLVFEEDAFFVNYYDNRFPISPDTYTLMLEYRIEELRNMFSEDDPRLAELLSIITSIRHLPLHTEDDPEKIAERHREKELIKKRLFLLYDKSADIKNFIDGNIEIFNGAKGDPKSFNLLDGLLNEQVWRLSYWRVAMEEINYRRFFDLNDTIAIRMEDPRVLGETHKKIFELAAKGRITGIRVDHADGLYDPSGYFRRLQEGCRTDPPFFVITEKILTKGEKIPDDWAVSGTTGYHFLNHLNGIFVDSRNSKAFDRLYSQFIKSKINFQDAVYESKKLVMQTAMSGEIGTLGHYLYNISEKNRHTRDFTLNSLTRAIIETIAFFPVYRTYINTFEVNDRDRQYIETAISKARRRNPAISSSVFDFLGDILLLKFPDDLSDEDKKERLVLVMKFQQITGPVMAKGLEDTSFYVYNRLISLNEVGGNPERFGTTLDAFHGQGIERSKRLPHSLMATSTHDTKRSEDVRARINVLSEIPGKWRECLIKWSRLNKKKKAALDGQPVPDRNEECLLYQTLVGAWPVDPVSEAEYDDFKKRIKDYMIKAIREAKINTSWISPNAAYEDAVISFVDSLMSDKTFLKDFGPFQNMISHYGMLNSISQTLLKSASPGVPDFYQGNEIWDFSLVDPDNRRPVDYEKRIKLFEELKQRESEIGQLNLARELTANKNDGKIKLYLINKTLSYRKENRELFDGGEYIPLEAGGEKAYHVCAFARRTENSTALVIVPRFYTKLAAKPEEPPLGREAWGDTFVVIPFERPGVSYRNIFTGETVATSEQNGTTVMFLSDIFSNFPVALMIRSEQ